MRMIRLIRHTRPISKYFAPRVELLARNGCERPGDRPTPAATEETHVLHPRLRLLPAPFAASALLLDLAQRPPRQGGVLTCAVFCCIAAFEPTSSALEKSSVSTWLASSTGSMDEPDCAAWPGPESFAVRATHAARQIGPVRRNRAQLADS